MNFDLLEGECVTFQLIPLKESRKANQFAFRQDHALCKNDTIPLIFSLQDLMFSKNLKPQPT